MYLVFRDRVGLGIAMESIVKRRKAESYAVLLEPAYSLCPKSLDNSLYNPYLVDNPDFQTGRNKIVITLPCFKGSIIQHSKESDVSKAQNEYLRERLPGLDENISLYDIRDLKSKMIEIAKSVDMEISSLASAIVFLEKLIVKVYFKDLNYRIL